MAGAGTLSAKVAYAVPVDVAYAYLADPRNRPEWQSSLARVEMLDDGEPRVGMRWRDITRPGVKPEMVITEMQRGVRWAETGTWRAIEAELVLDFSPRISSERTGCLVVASFGVHGRGALRPVGWGATLGGLLAVRSDLRRAARILADREEG